MSDTAEYWWGVKNRTLYTGKDFRHHPNKLCTHYNPITGNVAVTPYIKDINCYECKSKIESGEFSKDELKFEDSPEDYYMTNSGKKRFKKQKEFNEKHGICPCGCIWQIKTNTKTKQQFLGCVNYPKCTNTKPLITQQ